MIFTETKLKGVYLTDLELIEDERGFFTRTWCVKEFSAHGLNSRFQCSASFSKNKGTLRGMHYQAKPHEEAKVIRCAAGAIYDVIVDLRAESATFKRWVALN